MSFCATPKTGRTLGSERVAPLHMSFHVGKVLLARHCIAKSCSINAAIDIDSYESWRADGDVL